MEPTSTSPHFDISPKAPEVAQRDIPAYGCGGRIRIEAILDSSSPVTAIGNIVTVCGWARTVRKQGRELVFIVLTDGSCSDNLQVVVSKSGVPDEATWEQLQHAGVAYSFRIVGEIVESPAKGQKVELSVRDPAAHSVKIYGEVDLVKYPLSKKQHSVEFLRENQHLRARANRMAVTLRIRSAVAGATHEFFQSRGFQYIHTPVITCSDCEGAGEMFQVTTLLPGDDQVAKVPLEPTKKMIDYKDDFFGRKAMLTVSGQLNGETMACALSDIYTFGPTFRAENSHTSRHLAEFWMIEPEIAFADLEDNMRCAESYLRYCVQYVLERHPSEIAWLEANVEEGLKARLENIAHSNFGRISYTEAIEILKQQPADRFQVSDIHWGMDLHSEHERFLSEEHFKKPVIVYDYPYEIKAFYMKVNPDGKTVRAMDILVPKIGEVVGGSQREESLNLLMKQIGDKKLDLSGYGWYLDLRRYGTVPHSGFGVGFERLVMMITGIENIRDVIPFPRYPGAADF